LPCSKESISRRTCADTSSKSCFLVSSLRSSLAMVTCSAGVEAVLFFSRCATSERDTWLQGQTEREQELQYRLKLRESLQAVCHDVLDGGDVTNVVANGVLEAKSLLIGLRTTVRYSNNMANTEVEKGGTASYVISEERRLRLVRAAEAVEHVAQGAVGSLLRIAHQLQRGRHLGTRFHEL
jgi:hypothetical protein